MLDAQPMKIKKPRGRPPLDRENGNTLVAFRLSCQTYDELYAQARAARLDISGLIRRFIDSGLLRDRRHASRDDSITLP